MLTELKEEIKSVDFQRALYNGKARIICSALLFALTFTAVLFVTSFLPQMAALPTSEELDEETTAEQAAEPVTDTVEQEII